MADKRQRLARIRAARAALEAEAKEAARPEPVVKADGTIGSKLGFDPTRVGLILQADARCIICPD